MTNPLTVAVSARSLFDLEEANRIFEEMGLDAFERDQQAKQDVPLPPGPAFPLVKALLDLNRRYEKPVVQIIIASSIHPATGLRVIQSVAHHGLPIKRSSFTGGGTPTIDLLKAYDVDLFLSRSEEDTQNAVNNGIAAALMYDAPKKLLSDDDQIIVALDGDAVIFSDVSERIYKEKGLEAFAENERALAKVPLPEGPFAKLLMRMQKMQDEAVGKKPFRIVLVTARGGPAQERPIRTLNGWGVRVDECHFLSGYRKDRILEAIGPHIFVDDQDVHVDPASKVVPAGRVPYVNERAPTGETAVAVEAVA